MDLCLVLLEDQDEGVGEGLIDAFLLNAGLDDLTFASRVIDEDLCNFTLLVVLALGQVDRDGKARVLSFAQ